MEGDAEMMVCEIDLREGGKYRLEGRVAGKKWSIWGSYLEVRPPDRLVYTWSWKHDPGLGESTGDTQVTVEFREVGAETELVLTHERFASVQARDEHTQGWTSCLNRLEPLATLTKE